MRAIREVPNEWTRVLAPDASPDCSGFLLRHQPEGSRARQIVVDKDSRCTQFIHSLSTSSILCRELPSNLNIRAFTDQCPLVERGAQATATKQKDRRVQIFCLRESAITVYAIQHSRDFCRFDSTSRSRRYEVLIRFALKEDEPTLPIRLTPIPTICSVSPWTAGKGRRRRIEEAIRLIPDCSENRTGV